MNLRVTRIRKRSATLVGAPDGGGVAVHGVRAEIVHVAVPASRQHHRVSRVRRHFASHQVACDNTARPTVHQHQVQHLLVRVHVDRAQRDLPLQRLVGAQQQLLPCLASRVKRARNLRTTK